MKFRLIILFSLLFIFGCVKNTISIYIKPDVEFDMTIYASGDKNDILDDDIKNLLLNIEKFKKSQINIDNNLDELMDM